MREMKKIEAVIRPERLETVLEELRKVAEAVRIRTGESGFQVI